VAENICGEKKKRDENKNKERIIFMIIHEIHKRDARALVHNLTFQRPAAVC
jgi:hypothetical protein